MEIKKWDTSLAKDIIKGIHKYNPKYVFLTETSTTPVGYTIREALRKAYPNEPIPKFYRIDPRQVIEVMKEGKSLCMEKRLMEGPLKIKKKNCKNF